MSDNQPVIVKSASIHGQQLELFPIAEVEVNGIQMGVLSDGTPYLSLRGLARMCGVNHFAIQGFVSDWPSERLKPRGRKIQELLDAQGFRSESLYITAIGKGGETYAFTDKVCMAVLEYYAFEATKGSSEIAMKNFRLLARLSFRKFIFDTCGYDPDAHIPQSWRNFHERILLNEQIPVGYFSVFKEVSQIIIQMIKGGCPIDDHTIPDISVGNTWSDFWKKQPELQQRGERRKHPHIFPEWFPQSQANPVEAWIYPDECLGAFRRWLYEVYLPQKFPKYVESKMKKGDFLPTRGKQLIETLSRPELQE